VADASQQEWLKDLIEAQADFTPELTSSYTSTARSAASVARASRIRQNPWHRRASRRCQRRLRRAVMSAISKGSPRFPRARQSGRSHPPTTASFGPGWKALGGAGGRCDANWPHAGLRAGRTMPLDCRAGFAWPPKAGDRSWATPARDRVRHPIARLRDFSGSAGRGTVPDAGAAAQAGHDSCIVDSRHRPEPDANDRRLGG